MAGVMTLWLMSAAFEARLNLYGARWWLIKVLQGFSDVGLLARDFGCLVESLLMMVGLVGVRNTSLGQNSRANERVRKSQQ
jgi:hypothetical protein